MLLIGGGGDDRRRTDGVLGGADKVEYGGGALSARVFEEVQLKSLGLYAGVGGAVDEVHQSGGVLGGGLGGLDHGLLQLLLRSRLVHEGRQLFAMLDDREGHLFDLPTEPVKHVVRRQGAIRPRRRARRWCGGLHGVDDVELVDDEEVVRWVADAIRC